MRVVATSSQSSMVVVESGNQVSLNLLNIGCNKRNISNLSDWISNQVYRLCSDEELHLTSLRMRPRTNEIHSREDK